MKELVKTHRKAIETHTQLDYQRLASITYLYEFDRELQLVSPTSPAHGTQLGPLANHPTRCPLWGYPTEDAYYRDASSTDAVLAIRIPFLAIHAVDDPVSPHEIPNSGDFIRLLTT